MFDTLPAWMVLSACGAVACVGVLFFFDVRKGLRYSARRKAGIEAEHAAASRALMDRLTINGTLRPEHFHVSAGTGIGVTASRDAVSVVSGRVSGVLRGNQIAQLDVLVDGQSVSESYGVGVGAQVGNGLLMSGGSTTVHRAIVSLVELRIITNDPRMPLFSVSFISQNTDKRSSEYAVAAAHVEWWYALLTAMRSQSLRTGAVQVSQSVSVEK